LNVALTLVCHLPNVAGAFSRVVRYVLMRLFVKIWLKIIRTLQRFVDCVVPWEHVCYSWYGKGGPGPVSCPFLVTPSVVKRPPGVTVDCNVCFILYRIFLLTISTTVIFIYVIQT